MSTTKKRNYNDLLIWSAAAVTVIRYSAAFISSDVGKIEGWLSELVTFGLGLSGLGMGLLDVIGGMMLFQGWRMAIPRSGQRWSIKFTTLTFFVFGLILNGIIIIVPFTVSRVLHESMDIVLGRDWGLWVWAATVNIAPYILVGGIAVSSNVVETDTTNPANGKGSGSRTFANSSEQIPVEGRTFASLDPTEKYYIANEPDAKKSARTFGVTERAIQKWRLRISDEIAQGKL